MNRVLFSVIPSRRVQQIYNSWCTVILKRPNILVHVYKGEIRFNKQVNNTATLISLLQINILFCEASSILNTKQVNDFFS